MEEAGIADANLSGSCTTSCIQFFRGQGETVQVHLQRVTQAKKNKVMQLLQFGSTSLALMR